MINVIGASLETFRFPCGEWHVILRGLPPRGSKVSLEYDHPGGNTPDQMSNEIVQLMLALNALDRAGVGVATFSVPYVPFSRQDRVTQPGEPLSVAIMASIINSFAADEVVICDPHSDVTTALIRNVRVIPQHEIFLPMIPREPCLLISPDGGALKKIYKLAELRPNATVVECRKSRDVATGQLSGATVHAAELKQETCFIVDDICDGGGTFIALAAELKKKGAGRITLLVTHGFFTKGLTVFHDIDAIYTRKGKIK